MALKEATNRVLVRKNLVLGLEALQSGSFGRAKVRGSEGLFDESGYVASGVGPDAGERLSKDTARLQSVEQIVDGVRQGQV